MNDKKRKREMPDSYWQEHLSPQQYEILRKKSTEQAFSGDYVDHKESGVYACAGCGEALFSSGTKYDSGSGWPSFDRVANSTSVELVEDNSHGMNRIEVQCANCGGHLGHLFPDGPTETGNRYCINSCSLDFKSDNAIGKEE